MFLTPFVRDADGYICAAAMVKIDEEPHGDREIACEGGKVDDTFEAACSFAQREGKSRLGVVRSDDVKQPYVLFTLVNPNACDASGDPFRMKTRIEVTTAIVGFGSHRRPA